MGGEDRRGLGHKAASMQDVPHIMCSVTFLRQEEGGRSTLPDLDSRKYMPHLVVQSPDVRWAPAGKMPPDDYLGVRFIAGGPLRPGEACQTLMELMYHPGVDYSAIAVGATFTIREGPRIVGFGQVLERSDPVLRQ